MPSTAIDKRIDSARQRRVVVEVCMILLEFAGQCCLPSETRSEVTFERANQLTEISLATPARI
jgi:hypothetical protein